MATRPRKPISQPPQPRRSPAPKPAAATPEPPPARFAVRGEIDDAGLDLLADFLLRLAEADTGPANDAAGDL